MSEWKEVWYHLPTGKELPSNAEYEIVCGTKVFVIDVFDWGLYCMYQTGMKAQTPFCLVEAYTTGQKRRRVECASCDDLIEIGAGVDEECPYCHGTGKVWEYSE